MAVQSIESKAEFENKVLRSPLPVLADFWASWCVPCNLSAPAVEELAEYFEGKAAVVKVDIDQQPEIAGQCDVLSIPTFVLFKNGKEVTRIVGYRPQEDIAAVLEKTIKHPPA